MCFRSPFRYSLIRMSEPVFYVTYRMDQYYTVRVYVYCISCIHQIVCSFIEYSPPYIGVLSLFLSCFLFLTYCFFPYCSRANSGPRMRRVGTRAKLCVHVYAYAYAWKYGTRVSRLCMRASARTHLCGCWTQNQYQEYIASTYTARGPRSRVVNSEPRRDADPRVDVCVRVRSDCNCIRAWLQPSSIGISECAKSERIASERMKMYT